MRSLAVKDGKLFIGTDGNIAQVSALDAIKQNCETAMRTSLDEMYFNQGEGIPYFGTVWDQYNPLQFAAAARSTLEAVEGVTDVSAFAVTRTGNDLLYTATINTIYGTTRITNNE